MQVRKKHNKMNSCVTPQMAIRSVVNSPYRRINRVNKMIESHRQEGSESNGGEKWYQGANLLKPQFKIKSVRNVPKKGEISHQGSHGRMVHVRNFTLDHFYTPKQEDIEERQGANDFQNNFKNKCRLQRKVNKTIRDASLLDRLNKLTEKAPLNRYKSRAVGMSTRVAPLSGNF